MSCRSGTSSQWACTRDATAFFFQAEDGIRGHCVTGVQTCALPISAVLQLARPNRARLLRSGARRPESSRSEERRVGKECRSRWSRYHEKKKKREHPER